MEGYILINFLVIIYNFERKILPDGGCLLTKVADRRHFAGAFLRATCTFLAVVAVQLPLPDKIVISLPRRELPATLTACRCDTEFHAITDLSG